MWPRLLAVLLLSACGPSDEESAEAEWVHAEALWRPSHRDLGAYDAWLALDPGTARGREAHRRLEEADAHYREGIRRLTQGEAGSTEALLMGVAIAPMDPDHYLALARASAARGVTGRGRATEYYMKYLAVRPEGLDAEAARSELEELDPALGGIFGPPSVVADATEDQGPSQMATAAVSAVVGSFLTIAIGLIVLTVRRRGEPLSKLAERSPELHPAIAYLVGSLRHELLKHRIGAVGDALKALGRGGATEAQLRFIEGRLFGGEPLVSSWKAHLASFERALGYRLELRRDRDFRRADRAIRRIARLEGRISQKDPSVQRTLAGAYDTLQAFDRELAQLVHRLVRTRIDAELLETVVSEVRGEYAPSQVALDSLEVVAPEEEVEVEVFRVDLVLILKNVVRNAILAVERSEPPKKVSVDARVELEATGEEIVYLRVRDTSTESLSRESIYDRRVDWGLGLVTAALTRYDGAIEVQPAEDGFHKAVSVRFFRALDMDEE